MSGSEGELLKLAPPHAIAVSLVDAARMLDVSSKTLWREVQRGKLKAFRVGRSYRVKVAELHAYIDRQESEGRASA